MQNLRRYLKKLTHLVMVKLVFIGDQSVGKTCLLQRCSEDKFSDTHMPTIGIDFKVKMMQIDDKRVKL